MGVGEVHRLEPQAERELRQPWHRQLPSEELKAAPILSEEGPCSANPVMYRRRATRRPLMSDY